MTSPKENSFDYIIIGAGLSGLQLALALINDSFFKNKSIAIFEPFQKDKNDKTWCFWEKGTGKWDALIYRQWKEGQFITPELNKSINMGEYSYKMIRSIDFYNYAFAELKKAKNVQLIHEKVDAVTNQICQTKQGNYHAKKIFDSRITAAFSEERLKGNSIVQHFKGFLIKHKRPVFNPSKFTMMDFRLPYQNACCFTYVLPFTDTEALVEFTFFSPTLLPEETYDKLIDKYIREKLDLEDYEILETEKGQIPMSDFPFWKENNANYLKIGTGGGWVKASSGYSFKNTEKKIQQVIENLKQNKSLQHQLFKKRFQFYDRILLRILKEKNHLGNGILQEMYLKNEANAIFKFLDEETTRMEEFKIINSFNRKPFLWSLLKDIF